MATTKPTPTDCCSSEFPGQIASFASSMLIGWMALYSESSAPAGQPVMRKKSTPKTSEPSRASLREIPEIDLAKVKFLGRGRHVEKARRSFATSNQVLLAGQFRD